MELAGTRSDLRNITNPEKSGFCDMGAGRKYHKSFEKCILSQKPKNQPFEIFEDIHIPNYKNRPFWDTFSPSKPPQIEKTSSLGYIRPY